MYTLLRRIRKRLMKEGKLKSYLAYAIGEIILVVIGILLALQINTWNQEKKNRALEARYYCQFLQDVVQDSLEIEGLILASHQRIAACNRSIAILQKDEVEMELITNEFLATLANASKAFIANSASFDDVTSSGNIKILSDLELKNLLSDYYSDVEAMALTPLVNAQTMVEIFLDQIKKGRVFPYLKLVTDNIDTTIVDATRVNPRSFATDEERSDLLDQCYTFLGINARNLQHYEDIRQKIFETADALKNKCSN